MLPTLLGLLLLEAMIQMNRVMPSVARPLRERVPEWMLLLGLLLLLTASTAIGWRLAWALEGMLDNKVVRPLLRRLADDSSIRQRSLAAGAVLFVFGFVLQFTATLF